MLYLFLALPFFVPLSAQEKHLPILQFNRLTAADGLPTNNITSSVCRDCKGFIWVGTGNGLSRYDGYNFKNYLNMPNDSSSLSSSMTLIDFAKTEGVADECLQTKLYPKKAELLKYIHLTGAIPDGFLEEEVTDVQVRLRNEPVEEAA